MTFETNDADEDTVWKIFRKDIDKRTTCAKIIPKCFTAEEKGHPAYSPDLTSGGC